MKYLYIKPGQIIELELQGKKQIIKVYEVLIGNNYALKIIGNTINPNLYDNRYGEDYSLRMDAMESSYKVRSEIIYHEGKILIAVAAMLGAWKGANLFLSLHKDTDYEPVLAITKEAVIGDVIAEGIGEVTVNIIGGEIVIDDSILKEKSNLAIVGNEVLGLQKVELVGQYQYRLFIEGNVQCGMLGQRFILLNDNIAELKLSKHLIGKKLFGKIISDGNTVASAEAVQINHPQTQ